MNNKSERTTRNGSFCSSFFWEYESLCMVSAVTLPSGPSPAKPSSGWPWDGPCWRFVQRSTVQNHWCFEFEDCTTKYLQDYHTYYILLSQHRIIIIGIKHDYAVILLYYPNIWWDFMDGHNPWTLDDNPWESLCKTRDHKLCRLGRAQAAQAAPWGDSTIPGVRSHWG